MFEVERTQLGAQNADACNYLTHIRQGDQMVPNTVLTIVWMVA